MNPLAYLTRNPVLQRIHTCVSLASVLVIPLGVCANWSIWGDGRSSLHMTPLTLGPALGLQHLVGTGEELSWGVIIWEGWCLPLHENYQIRFCAQIDESHTPIWQNTLP